jgi:hypothetical protein
MVPTLPVPTALAPSYQSPLTAADAPHAVLVRECDTVGARVARVPAAIQQRNELQRALEAAEAVTISCLLALSVSSGDLAYKDRPATAVRGELIDSGDRHEALRQKLTATCRELAKAKAHARR